MTQEEKWLRNYNLARKYYEEHGNLLIQKRYILKDEGNG
ncbi:MAG: helicase associated domain-containing protein [Bacilli bacterium]|nr:helicase associated domain-containing protein [Bacilli bacterium]